MPEIFSKGVNDMEDHTNLVLAAIQRWYYSMCDGNWEHNYGIRIDTIDNPGWTVSIDIPNDLKKTFEPHVVHRSDDNWIECKVADGCFLGYGGPKNLTEILSIFCKWIAV